MELPAHLKETGELLDFGISFGNALGKSLDDGKLDYMDAPSFLNPIMSLIPAIDGAPTAIVELAHLSEEDKTLLIKYVEVKFDIPSDEIEVRIEQAIAFGISALAYVRTWF